MQYIILSVIIPVQKQDIKDACGKLKVAEKCYLIKFMAHPKTTGKKAATAASKTLRDGRTSRTSKTAAGSSLSQKHGRKSKR
ncbi:MAG: hypothetical protein KJI69_00530 [Patescibacteria group bacterium]|nr:hypothetical protein [Patescibacteria group bacterium]